MQPSSQPTLFKLLRMPLVVAIAIATIAGVLGWMLGPLRPDSAKSTIQVVPSATQPTVGQSGDAASFAEAWEQLNRKAGAGRPKPAVTTPGGGISSATDLAVEDREMIVLYAQFDAQLKPVSSLPVWAMNRNLHAEVSGADANATVSSIACAEEFCRFKVASSGGTSREELLDKLGSSFADKGSAVMYRYPDNNSHEAVVYLMNGATPLARNAETQDAVR